MSARIGCAAVLALALLGGCQPLTFSHEAVIDFGRYQRVYVQPIAITGGSLLTGTSVGLQDYLIRELEASSGFAVITGNPAVDHDVVLVVSIRFDEDYDPDDNDYEWTADTSWVLRTVGGDPVHAGDTYERDNDPEEAAEEALDALANVYLRAYRL